MFLWNFVTIINKLRFYKILRGSFFNLGYMLLPSPLHFLKRPVPLKLFFTINYNHEHKNWKFLSSVNFASHKIKHKSNHQENTSTKVSFLIKLQTWGLQLLKKRLWHRCFPLNFTRFLGASMFIEHSGGCFGNTKSKRISGVEIRENIMSRHFQVVWVKFNWCER